MESFLQQTNTENLKNLLSSAECTIGSVPLCPWVVRGLVAKPLYIGV